MPSMLAFLLAITLSAFAPHSEASPFRVLIFPHHGNYPTPQGREAVISHVGISSTEVCNQYVAVLNSKSQWEKQGPLLSSETQFVLKAHALKKQLKNLAQPELTADQAFYFECTRPFKVSRGSLTAYTYEGNFVAQIEHRGNRVKIINLIEAERYLLGVVASEVGPSWPAEAMKAQAIAARTYAWWTTVAQRTSSPRSSYDFDDTVQYQAYTGISSTPEIEAAVNDTQNLVMKYEGNLIKAYFSADSGGKTESAENVFGEKLPYCVSQQEQYDISQTKTSWNSEQTPQEVAQLLLKASLISEGTTVEGITVDAKDRNSSGRADAVMVKTLSKEGLSSMLRISGFAFRRALKLRSTLFHVSTLNDGKIRFAGRGFGHGVGMAQVGAKEYALQLGWGFEQILKFYYTGITIEAMTEFFENE